MAMTSKPLPLRGLLLRSMTEVEDGDINCGDHERLAEPKWEFYGKFEPRFKPPRETLASGQILQFNYLPLAGYHTEEDAKIVHQIAAFYYGKAEGQLDLGDGRHYSIASSWNEQERCLYGKEKAKWVSRKAKEVFEDFEKAKATRALPSVTNGHTSVHSGEQIINACDSFYSPAIYKSAEELASSSEASPLVESSAVGERRTLLHGPLQSSMLATEVDVPSPDRANNLVQFAPQHVKAFVAPAIDLGHNLVAPQDIIAFPDQGNVGVAKELSVGGEIVRPVQPSPSWRLSNVNQNLSGPMLVPTSAEQCPSVSEGLSAPFDPSFQVEEIETWMPSVPQDDGDVSMSFLDDLYNIPQDEFELSGMQPQQHLQDNRWSLDSASAAPMFDDHNPSDIEPVVTLPAAWGSEGIPNVVQESSVVAATSNKVDEGDLIVHEGALHNSQASDSALTPHQGSDAVVDVVPSKGQIVKVGLLIQELGKQIEERDGKIEEQAKQIQERDREIEELKAMYWELIR